MVMTTNERLWEVREKRGGRWLLTGGPRETYRRADIWAGFWGMFWGWAVWAKGEWNWAYVVRQSACDAVEENNELFNSGIMRWEGWKWKVDSDHKILKFQVEETFKHFLDFVILSSCTQNLGRLRHSHHLKKPNLICSSSYLLSVQSVVTNTPCYSSLGHFQTCSGFLEIPFL